MLSVADLIDVGADAVVGGISFAMELECLVAVVQHRAVENFVTEAVEGVYLMCLPC